MQPMERSAEEIKLEEDPCPAAERALDGEVRSRKQVFREIGAPLNAKFQDKEGNPERPS